MKALEHDQAIKNNPWSGDFTKDVFESRLTHDTGYGISLISSCSERSYIEKWRQATDTWRSKQSIARELNQNDNLILLFMRHTLTIRELNSDHLGSDF